MRWSDLPTNPSRSTLRQFAGLWLLVFLGLACREWYARVSVRAPLPLFLSALALTVGPLGLVYPRAVRPIFVTWMVLAFPIGWVVSWLTLGFVFFAVVTPVGLALRLFGHDPLALRRPRGETSYWRPKPAVTDVRRYFRRY